MKSDPIATRAKALRNQGLSYAAIGARLGISGGKVWIILNREAHNANSRESASRYRARGYKALCDA